MNNINSLISFNHAFMSYKDFIFNRPNQLSQQPIQIKTLEILFSCLNIILNKDRITTKDENKDNYIDDNILEQIISIICKKIGNKYYLGNIPFENKDEIIKIIRNKIAHGEFIIDSTSDNIILNIQEHQVKIPKNALYSFTILLIERIDLYTTSSTYQRIQIYGSTSNTKRIKHYNNINDILDNIYYIEYNFHSNNSITPEKKALIEELLKQIPNTISLYEEKYNTKLSPNLIRSYFNQYGIEVEPIINPLSKTKHANKLSLFIKENISEIRKMDLKTQIVLISNWYQKLLNDDKPLENITDGIHYNLYVLNSLENNDYKSLNQAIQNISSNNLFTSILEMILVTELLGFYAHYQYPLENICKSKDNTNDGIDYFDYSKLDLQVLKPTIFIIPQGRQSSYNNAVTASQKRLSTINIELEKIKTQQANIKRLLSTSKTNEEQEKLKIALEALNNKISKIVEEQLEELETLKKREQKLNEFNLDDNSNYYYNRYLIEYIRNAIAHGNVHFYFSNSSTNLENATIRFINKKDNQTTLDLTISIKEFDNLFNPYNISILDEYLHTKKNKAL